MSQPFFLGGQAVIEGVMMRSPNHVAIAVRRAQGEIVVRREAVRSLVRRYPLLNKLFIRGIFALFESLTLGMRALNYSAEIAMQDEAAKTATQDLAEGKPERQKKKRKAKSDPLNEPAILGGAIAFTIVLAFLLGITIFVIFPNLVADWIAPLRNKPMALNLAEGVIRLIIFVIYVSAIGMMKDIRRVFQYHGAEHKVVWTVEEGKALDVQTARSFPIAHPRCGTNFVFIVLIVSIIAFSFLGWNSNVVVRVVTRLCLLPVIAGVSYEFIRLMSSQRSRWWSQVCLAPGLAMQRLTTREPEDDQIEVAIKAMEAVLVSEKESEPAVVPSLAADLVPAG